MRGAAVPSIPVNPEIAGPVPRRRCSGFLRSVLRPAYEILRQQELAGKAGAADRDCCRQAGANLPKGGEKLCARDVNADRLESHGFTRPALGKPSDVGADQQAEIQRMQIMLETVPLNPTGRE